VIAPADAVADDNTLVGTIPVRNIWLLFAYASDLTEFYSQHESAVEASPTVPDLVARLLNQTVENRLRRSLSRSYETRSAVVTRVRGRINLLQTLSHDLLNRGEVACVFEDFTIDTPRNRFVRAALNAVAPYVSDAEVARHSRALARRLGAMGVSGERPSRAEIGRDKLGRNDRADKMMIALATFVFDALIPSMESGGFLRPKVDQTAQLVRRLFERAIGNFYAAELRVDCGWGVRQGRKLHWPLEAKSEGLLDVLPNMEADIVLEHTSSARRLIIDTKFTSIFTRSLYRERVLKSGYLYQIYGYVRSQEDARDPASLSASGLLLHPAIGANIDECAVIQGHRFRFATIDLTGKTEDILARLRSFASDLIPMVKVPSQVI